MNPAEKKRLSNLKRLKALLTWKIRYQQPIKVEGKPVRKTYDEPEVKSNDKSKLTLFDSDEEDNYEADFNIRPQFEGEKGQKLLERNTYLSSRFKLDERFKEDDEEEIPEIPVKTMAYLAKARKDDLKTLATDLDLEIGEMMRVIDFKNLILTSKDYDEQFTKTLLETIIETRVQAKRDEKEENDYKRKQAEL
ncbi:uncharacterized protein TNCV_3190071 [Trichonephila clavipes]|nr:uncharacterized protein TNCV_3190071 [Trichonephila clavipes]